VYCCKYGFQSDTIVVSRSLYSADLIGWQCHVRQGHMQLSLCLVLHRKRIKTEEWATPISLKSRGELHRCRSVKSSCCPSVILFLLKIWWQVILKISLIWYYFYQSVVSPVYDFYMIICFSPTTYLICCYFYCDWVCLHRMTF
jgi:hypothetical protein